MGNNTQSKDVIFSSYIVVFITFIVFVVSTFDISRAFLAVAILSGVNNGFAVLKFKIENKVFFVFNEFFGAVFLFVMAVSAFSYFTGLDKLPFSVVLFCSAAFVLAEFSMIIANKVLSKK